MRRRGWPANTRHPWKECIQDVRVAHEALQEEVVQIDHSAGDAPEKRPWSTGSHEHADGPAWLWKGSGYHSETSTVA